jgi:DNA-binding MltR family transcriptional regulator
MKPHVSGLFQHPRCPYVSIEVMRKIKIGRSLFDIHRLSFDGIDSKQVATIFHELEAQNDRNAVIVATSIIDDILNSRIRSLVKCGSPKDHNALFADNGPFASMYCKIEWLYCIGELPSSIRKDIHIIRKLRNDAAHKWHNFDFSNEIYSKLLKRISLYRLIDSFKEIVKKEEQLSSEDYVWMENRTCFDHMVSLLIILLSKEITNGGKA